MLLTLLCACPHPSVPALAAGERLAFVRVPGGLALTLTPNLLRRLAQAVADEALVLATDCPPALEVIEAEVQARYERLTACLEALAHPPLEPPSLRAAS